MKVLVSGASGLVGTALVPALRAAGHQVARLVRDRARAVDGDLYWNPQSGEVDPGADTFDAAVNLAGESIAAGRWTAAKKQRIHDSRVSATSTISTLVAKHGASRTLLNASAIGFYGNRGDQRLDESSPRGRGDFLSQVCQDWEAATEAASSSGARVVLARFGVILSKRGGALKKMLLPFRLGLGGKIGSGSQYMSWIALDDVVGGILHSLANASLRGPVNFVAPTPVTNLQYTKTLGRVLHRPTLFPMPSAAARLAFGQMADELLLSGQRVEPARLISSNYIFQYATLEEALRHVLA
jgi:uncharacterized protein (TIGR01777 family)